VPYRAVIFDLGGVVFPSPFEAFDAYDAGNALDTGTTRALIRHSSETGAWARLERGELTMDEFVVALEAEARDAGFALDAVRLMELLGSSLGPRPEMTRAIKRIRAHGLLTAALTNNWSDAPRAKTPNGVHDADLFDVVVESAVEGLRKPDPRIYELVLERLDVRASETVFLDDLGINLKPARDMGITTIKVVDTDEALADLGAVLGLDVGRC
jgi:putative hydrolase of the HAD superfamily